MANRYWVGNGGSWSDTSHWSETSGGSGGVSAPTSSDDVYFDSNSFSLTDQTVTFLSGSVKSIDFSGVTNNPIIDFTSPSIFNYLTIESGSCVFSSNMVVSGYPSILFNNTCTFNSGGKDFYRLRLYGTLLTFLSDIYSEYINLHSGSLDTNGFDINSINVDIDSDSTSLILGDSIWTINETFQFTNLPSDEFEIISGTSKIICNGTFKSYDQTFYDLEFSNSTTISIYYNITCNNLNISNCDNIDLYACNITANSFSVSGSAEKQLIIENKLGDCSFIQTSGSLNLNYITLVNVFGGVEISNDLCVGGTPTADPSYPEYPEFGPEYAFDDDSETLWISFEYSSYLQYDFGVGNEKIINRYSLTFFYDFDGFTLNFTLSGSNDEENWTLLDSRLDESSGSPSIYNFENSTSYRFYRLNLELEGGEEMTGIAVYEMEMFEFSYSESNYNALLTNGNIDGGGNIGWIFEEDSDIKLLYMGLINLQGIYLGSTSISKIYVGSTLIWEV